MSDNTPAPALSEMLLTVVRASLLARRAELDALHFGHVHFQLEVREGQPFFLRVTVEETQTRHALEELLCPGSKPS